MYVKVGSHQSATFVTDSGVFEGSILSPLLFLIFSLLRFRPFQPRVCFHRLVTILQRRQRQNWIDLEAFPLICASQATVGRDTFVFDAPALTNTLRLNSATRNLRSARKFHVQKSSKSVSLCNKRPSERILQRSIWPLTLPRSFSPATHSPIFSLATHSLRKKGKNRRYNIFLLLSLVLSFCLSFYLSFCRSFCRSVICVIVSLTCFLPFLPRLLSIGKNSENAFQLLHEGHHFWITTSNITCLLHWKKYAQV